MKFSNKRTIYLTLFIALFTLFMTSNLNPISLQERKNKSTIQHEVTVTLKLVQVYVTDKKGNPVVDLKKEDFVIYDNGKKQPITEFEIHLLHFPPSKTEVQTETILESKLPAPRELLSRKFFLLFDFAYNNARGLLKAKQAALHFIDTQLQPQDELGLLSYSALGGLNLHEYLTTDHMKVRQVVESFGMKEKHGRAENFEVEYWRQLMEENPLDASKRGGVFNKEPEVPELGREESRLQARYFIPKMIDLAKAFRYIPGYKHIILFSSGVPYTLIYGIQLPGKRSEFGDLGDPQLRHGYEDMLKELSASNSTIYSLDTQDLISNIGVDSRATGASILQKMASSTGGKYFGNINRYEKHMEKIQDLTGCFYVVGYYVDEKWDGKYHEIKVEVNRPGCRVHAQKGYFNPKPFHEYSKLEKMLHLVDLALSEEPLFQTPLRFPMTTLPCPSGKDMNLCLVSRIPLEKIQDILKGEVEIISVIFDAADNIVEFERREESLPKLPENDVYYYSLFSLSPGEYKCRLVIRNLETGRGAVAASQTVIFERKVKGIELFPPLLLSSEKNALYVKGSVPRGKADSFSLADYFHFDSARYAPIVEEELESNSIVSAVVPYSVSDTLESEVTISASLIEQSSGEIIPLQVITRSEAKERGLSLRFVEIQIPELPSGEYVLNLAAEEAKSQSASQLTKIFKVK